MATEGSTTTATTAATTTRTNTRSIPPIYLSYSNQTGFFERYFVVQLYRELVKHGLGEGVIWFDHDQNIHPDKSPTWLADRLEAIDLSLGSLLILSDACQHLRFMTIETKAIVDRKLLSGPSSSIYGLFVIFLDECPNFAYIRQRADFSYTFSKSESLLSVDERISIVLPQILGKLLPYKKFQTISNPTDNNEQKAKAICSWTTKDIQAFLTRIAVHESSRELFSQRQIDGYLLLACTENELKDYFAITNRKIRQTLIEHVIEIIHHERQALGQWHYAAKKTKGKSDCVYIIHDPEDFTIASHIASYLREKNLRVFSHNGRYGKSREEFLALNGPTIGRAKDVICLLTEKSCRSTFTFHELTFAEWLEKPIVTIYIDNVWTHMRSSVRALLADYPSIDFIHQPLSESLTILHTYLRPQVLSADETPEYIQKLKETVRPLATVAASNRNSKQRTSSITDGTTQDHSRFVYLSYSKINEKWNVVHGIERLILFLESHHFYTGIPTASKTNTSRENDPHFLPKIQPKSSSIIAGRSHADSFRSSISPTMDIRQGLGAAEIRNCRVMIVCLTPNYFRNEHCLNELRLCEIYQKPLIVCLLRQMEQYGSHQFLATSMTLEEQITMCIPSKLPMTTLNYLRKYIRTSCIDLTTNELFSRNAQILIRRLETLLGIPSNSMVSPTSTFKRHSFTQSSEVF